MVQIPLGSPMSVIETLNKHLGKTPDEIARALKPVPEITVTLTSNMISASVIRSLMTPAVMDAIRQQQVAYDELNQRAILAADRGYAGGSIEGNLSTRNLRSEDFSPVVGSSRTYWATSAD